MSDFIPASPDDLNDMAASGFTPDQINDYRQKSMDDMAHAGFSSDQIQKYYGVKEPDLSAAKKHVQTNIQAIKAEESEKGQGGAKEPDPPPIQPVEAKTILEGLEAGWGSSFTGLFMHGKMSPIAISENSSRAVKIASMVAQFAGDVPAMAAGMVAGSALGGAAGTATVPILGTISGAVIGAAAGGFAAPPAMRKMLTEQCEKGDIKSAGDFADRVMAASWEGIKGGVTGAATALVGPAGAYVGTAGKLAAEAATMATVSSALEGHLPEPDDFINGAIMIGGFHAVSAGMPKLYEAYNKTGLTPNEVVERAKTDPVLKQEVLAAGDEFPKSLEPLVEKEAPVKEPSPKSPIEEDPELAKARENVRAKIGNKIEADKKGYGLKDFYQDYVDKLDPIKELETKLTGEGEKVAPDESPYKLMRMANDYKAKAKHVFENGTLDYETLKVNGKSFDEVIAPVRDKLQQAEEYLVSKRALEIEKNGKESGFDVADTKKIVKADKGEFDKTAKELVAFQNRNLQYLKDSGRISGKMYDAMEKMGKAYIPFARLLDPVEDFSGMQKPGKSDSLKALKGSDLGVQHPFLSVLENTEKMMKMAEMNRAKVSLVKLAEETGNTDYFKKVPGNRMVKVDALPEVNKLLEDVGIDSKDLGLEEFNVFRSQEKDLAANQFEVWRDGKREVYEIQDERVAKAIKSLDGNPGVQNIFMKIARQFTAIKRIGTTMTPDFILKNFTRDQMTAGVFSEYGTLPFKEVFTAMGDLWKENDHYYNWLKSGGANGAFLELNSKYLEKDIFKLGRETGFINNMQNTLTSAKDVIALAGHIIESAPRLAEFKRASQGASEGPKVFEGGFQSREITVDFQRMGLKVQTMNSIAAFMNAQIQGLDRTARALKEDPVGTSVKGLAMLTGPSVILWALQHEDDRYKEIPQWEKDMFWNVVTHDWQPAHNDEEAAGLPEYMVKDSPQGKLIDKGIIFRIPKPQELGLLFATIPERLLEGFLTDHPDAGKELAKTIMGLMTPNMVPDIGAPIAEHMTNYNMFTSRPLISQYLEKELPAYRYTEFTSETAKALGKILGAIPVIQETNGASPQVIENYVKGWSGQLGSYALQLVDAGLRKSGLVEAPVKPAWTVADIPFVKAFMVRNPTTQAESIQRFYDRANHLEQIITSTRNQMKKGNFGDVDYIERNFGEVGIRVDSFKKALSTQGQLIRGINEGDYTADDKRQLIDSAYYQMIETSRFANQTMDQYEKMVKDMKHEGKK